MRADDGDRDLAGGGGTDAVLGGERRLREAERAERQSALGMEGATEACEQRVLSRRSEKNVTPNGVPSSAIAAGTAMPARSSRLTKFV